jgi:uncharacterized protein
VINDVFARFLPLSQLFNFPIEGNRIMKWVKWVALLCLAIFMGGAVQAQEATPEASPTVLIPYNDPTFNITTVVPDGWTLAAPGVHVRGQGAGDVTSLIQQVAPATAAQVLGSLIPHLGLQQAPDSTGTQTTDAFTWTLYKVDVQAAGQTISVDMALAEADGKTYLVLMQTDATEYDTLHQQVFLPVLDALQITPAPEATATEEVPYTAEELTVHNGDITLAGTLTLPEGSGPHPAIVLITGSGAEDRDESIAPLAQMKPFKLIADYLTRRGIAVLRLDDRGVGGSNGDLSTATIADLASDISAAIDALRERDDINPDQIGVLGHSEGGDVSAVLGATDPHVAFIVSMAGPAARGYDLLVTQNQRLLQLQGQTEEQIAHYTEVYRAFLDAVIGTDPAALEPALYNLVLLQLQNLPADQRATLGNLEDAARRLTTQQLPTMQGAVMRDLINYDPGTDWSKTTVPVLGLYGGKDVQVDAEQNAPALDAALKAAGNTDYQIVTFPTGNHLFQDAQTGGLEEYGTLPQEFLADFLPTIGDWILAHVTVPA